MLYAYGEDAGRMRNEGRAPHCIIHAYGVDDDNQEKSNIEKDDNT